jgi:hypothetical protein
VPLEEELLIVAYPHVTLSFEISVWCLIHDPRAEDDIQLLYEYDRWANNRVLQAVSTLSVGEFTRDLGGSFRSVRDTLFHIIGGEWGWRRREMHSDGNLRNYSAGFRRSNWPSSLPM